MTKTSDAQQLPRIPGVRYRTERRTRKVWEEIVPGQPREVEETYYVDVPVPPKDWDLIILRAVTGAAVAVTALSVAWTTASIGGLMSITAPAAVGYAAASVFDVVWLACLGLEWLNRREPDKGRGPRNAGWFGLAIAMGAVFAHGNLQADRAVGIVGAAVSLLAKGLWTVVLRQYHVPLGERTGGWLKVVRQEIAAAGIVAGERRRLHAQDLYQRALYGDLYSAAMDTGRLVSGQAVPAALGAPTPPPAPAPAPGGQPVPDTSGTVPAPAAAPVPLPVPPVPDPSGQPVPTPSAQQTPAPAASAPVPTPVPPAFPVPPVAPIGQSIAATIRAELAKDKDISDEDLIERVRAAHPTRDDSKLPGTVIRTRHREEDKIRRARKRRGAS
ncbi:hypothetical protein PV392_27620 [Streptomyces sp. ME03-5709C]|nr:hypothetical protein [Streptomyces sp. ME03-5709C]